MKARTIDGPGGRDRLADDHEDAGADDRAEAERGQVERADRALELGVLLLRLGDEDVDRLRGEEPVFAWTRRGRQRRFLPRCGRDDEDGAARALDQIDRHAAEHAAGDPALGRGAADDHVRVVLLGEEEHARDHEAVRTWPSA